MMTGYNNGRCPRNSLYSDCIIEEKTVVLQKKDNEGFGFVLRGAKADTPIEEFTPTPAFPALQYLESVDEGGVAWQAGLRTGDFLIEAEATAPWGVLDGGEIGSLFCVWPSGPGEVVLFVLHIDWEQVVRAEEQPRNLAEKVDAGSSATCKSEILARSFWGSNLKHQ
ncbi:hypothetical protein H8958_017578 [Nasalis larvatus]